MQNLVGNIIFAFRPQLPFIELTPYLVLEQTTFALTVVNARGGIHGLFTQTLATNGPSRHEIVGWHFDLEGINVLIAGLQQLLADKKLHLSDPSRRAGIETLHSVQQLRTQITDEITFYSEQLGRPFDDRDDDDLSDLSDDFDDEDDEDDEDDSEDEARAAGEAAAEELERVRASLGIGRRAAELPVIVCVSSGDPAELHRTLKALLG